MIKHTLACLAIIAATWLCWSSTSQAAPPLMNTRWRLVSFGPKDNVPKDVSITIGFFHNSQGYMAGGSAGCNGYNSSYTTSGSSIAFKGPTRTLLACSHLRYERRYIKRLPQADRFMRKGKTLRLYKGKQLLLRFVRAPIAHATLHKTRWKLSGWNRQENPSTSMSHPATVPMTLRFHKKGSYQGTIGCVSIQGTYKATKKTTAMTSPKGTYTVTKHFLKVSSLKASPLTCLTSAHRKTAQELIRIFKLTHTYWIRRKRMCLNASKMESLCLNVAS